MTILLVTGSRSLASYPDARERVEVVLEHIITTRGVLAVIHGGATGVDSWAHEVATALDVASVVRMKPYPDENPLDRNARMVREALLRAGQDARPVRCIGFVDPASKTRGADHTLTLAKRAGITTLRLVYGE